MKLSYRTRKTLKRIGIILLILAAVAVVVYGCWLLWLQRFVVYTKDEGAVFRFDQSTEITGGQLAVPPEDVTVPIYYNEGEDAIAAAQELQKVVGYYIDEKALKGDFSEIRAQIQQLDKGTPVMIDVKNIYGRFFYDSSVGDARTDSIDPAAVEELIRYISNSGMYTIARFSALRDYTYGLNHVPDGVPHSSGGYLYQDGDGCYWLNPDSSGTRKFLVDIIQELKALGFHEVVLTEFRFPQTESILYKGDKAQALADAAQSLVTGCATNSFAVSFVGDGSWQVPTGRTRLYVENIEASGIQDAVAASGVTDLDTGLVFVTPLFDTRFDEYGVLRPLDSFH